MGHDPGAKVKTSRLPPGGRRTGLLGLVVGYGSIWVEGVGRKLEGCLRLWPGADDGWTAARTYNFVWTYDTIQILSPHLTLSAITGRAIPLDGDFVDRARPQRTGEAAPYRLKQTGFHRQLHHASWQRYDPHGQTRSRNIARQAQLPWSVATADD